MTTKLFQRIALLTLPLAAVLAFVIGRFIAPHLTSLSPDISALLTLLGYVLGALVAVLVWAVALLPLRQKSGLTPLGEDFAQMRSEGVLNSLRREEQALEERRQSDDPRSRASYYKSLTLAGFGVTGVGALLSFALLSDGVLMVVPMALALAGLPVSIYYGIQYLRWSRR
jgi:CDP-diglyceride synthetase